MSLTKLFTWQFVARLRSYGQSSTLICNNLALTIAGSNLQNARSQAFVPPKQLEERRNVYYVSSKTGNEYKTIQEMILKEEPSISSDSGFIFTGVKNIKQSWF